MNLFHEFHRAPPAVHQLNWAIRRQLEPLGWRLEHLTGKDGYNSMYLVHPNVTQRFHLRWWKSADGKAVQVLDNYRRGKRLFRLETENEIARFCIKLTKLVRKP